MGFDKALLMEQSSGTLRYGASYSHATLGKRRTQLRDCTYRLGGVVDGGFLARIRAVGKSLSKGLGRDHSLSHHRYTTFT